MTRAGSNLGPAIDKDLQFEIPAENWGPRVFGPRPGAAAGLGRVERLERLHRGVESLQRQRVQRSIGEQPRRDALSGLGDHDASRLRRGLQPRGEVRRLSDNPHLANFTAAHEVVDHNEAGGDPNSRLADNVARQREAPHRFLQIGNGAHALTVLSA